MITSVRVIWLVNEGKKNEEEARNIFILEERKKEKKRSAVAMLSIQLICVGNYDG